MHKPFVSPTFSEYCRTYKLTYGILSPFRKTILLIMGLSVILESCWLFQSYIFAGLVSLKDKPFTFWNWLMVFVAIVIFEELTFRIDAVRDWQIIVNGHNSIYRFLHCKALEKFLSMEMLWHHENSSGRLIGKVQTGAEKILRIFEQMTWEFMPALFQLVITIIPVLWLSPYIVIIILVAFVLFMYFTYQSFVWRHPMRTKRYDLREQVSQLSVDFVQSVETTKIFGQYSRVRDEFCAIHDEVFDISQKEFRKQINCFHARRVRILIFAKTAIYSILIWQLTSVPTRIDLPSAFFVYTLVERLFSTFWRFCRLFEDTAEASEPARRLADLFAETPNIIPQGNFCPEREQKIDICFENVSFRYGHGEQGDSHIRNLNLVIPAGHIVALVGPSGAGKTTIQRLLSGQVEACMGRILLAGTEIHDWAPEALDQIFSYVPQENGVHIINNSFRYNIMFGNSSASEEQMIRAAKLAKIHEFISAQPQGYDTVVGEHGVQLSGGQKQRLALARAILADRPVLILDEATNSLDAITEREIQDQMADILEGKTVVIIAHRLSTVWDLADKIVVLSNGRKIEEGKHQELMAAEGYYSRLAKLHIA